MLEPVILLLAAATTFFLAPRVLTLRPWQTRHPQLALTAWFTAVGLGVVLALAGAAALIVAGIGAASLPPSESLAASVLSWGALGLLGGSAAIVALHAEPLERSHRARTQHLLAQTRASEHRGNLSILWLDAPTDVVCSIPGRQPRILVSQELRSLLTTAQLQAVLAHEFAHVRSWHGLAVRVAEVCEACTPRMLRAGRDLKRATLLLIELAADDNAARQAGAANLANALSRIGEASDDVGLLVRAERLTTTTWPRAHVRRVPELIRL